MLRIGLILSECFVLKFWSIDVLNVLSLCVIVICLGLFILVDRLSFVLIVVVFFIICSVRFCVNGLLSNCLVVDLVSVFNGFMFMLFYSFV